MTESLRGWKYSFVLEAYVLTENTLNATTCSTRAWRALRTDGVVLGDKSARVRRSERRTCQEHMKKKRGSTPGQFDSVDHYRVVEGASVRGATEKDGSLASMMAALIRSGEGDDAVNERALDASDVDNRRLHAKCQAIAF